MPIRRGAVNVARFRLEGDVPKDVKRWLARGLSKAAFAPIDVKSEDERAAGFVELDAPGASEFSSAALFYGEQALFSWRVDKLKVPASALRTGLSEWSQAFEKKNHRAPGRREKAEQKEQLKKALRARQEPVTKTYEISLDLGSRDVFVWATARTLIDEVHAALEGALDTQLRARVPVTFVPPSFLDSLSPTAELFVEVR